MPNRDEVLRILHRQSRSGQLPIVDIGLERRETVANGACMVLAVFIRNPNPEKRLPIAAEHMMGGDEPNLDGIKVGAAILGRAIAMRLGLSVENDAAGMLRDAS